MSNFTPLVEFSTQFDGDTVTMKLGRLKKKHMVRLLPKFLESIDDDNSTESEGGFKLNILKMMQDETEIAELAAEFIGEYVHEFKGLKDADGNAISLETVVEQNYFQDLMSSILKELISISSPSQQDMDSLGKQLPPMQEASG